MSFAIALLHALTHLHTHTQSFSHSLSLVVCMHIVFVIDCTLNSLKAQPKLPQSSHRPKT